jgi:hypothetical protein
MTPSLSFVLGLAVTAATLARAAARRRNRHVALWGVICFCCPIALLVIWSMNWLPPRQELPATSSGAPGPDLAVRP